MLRDGLLDLMTIDLPCPLLSFYTDGLIILMTIRGCSAHYDLRITIYDSQILLPVIVLKNAINNKEAMMITTKTKIPVICPGALIPCFDCGVAV